MNKFNHANEALRIVDNDADEVLVTLDGKEIRGWSYKDDSERRTKMLMAREYVEGRYVGRIELLAELRLAIAGVLDGDGR